MVMRHITVECEVRSVHDDEDLMTFVASMETVDRHGTIFSIKGMDLTQLSKNNPFLFMHNRTGGMCGGANAEDFIPLGNIVSARKIMKKRGEPDFKPRLEIDVRFVADNEEGDGKFAQKVKRLYERGVLKAVSIGAYILEFADLNEEEKEEKGLDPIFGELISRSELIEVSAVIIGSNKDALKKSIGDGDIDARDFNILTRHAEGFERDYEENSLKPLSIIDEDEEYVEHFVFESETRQTEPTEPDENLTLATDDVCPGVRELVAESIRSIVDTVVTANEKIVRSINDMKSNIVIRNVALDSVNDETNDSKNDANALIESDSELLKRSLATTGNEILDLLNALKPNEE